MKSIVFLLAPSGSGWWHWVMFNIPPNVHELQSGAGDPARALAPAGAAMVGASMNPKIIARASIVMYAQSR